MRANALIVGSSLPWAIVDDVPSGDVRIEAYLELGKVRNDNEITRRAEAELDRFREGQTQITVGVDPEGTGDVPFTDYGVGDTVTVDGGTRRVVQLAFGRDRIRDGRIVYVPQVGDRIDPVTTRLQRAAKKMSNGALGGAARTAQPSPPPAIPIDSQAGRLPVVEVTQAQYDALDPVLENVLYVIVD